MIDQICMTYYVFTSLVWVLTLIYHPYSRHKDWVFVACGLVTVTAAIVAAVQLINYIWT